MRKRRSRPSHYIGILPIVWYKTLKQPHPSTRVHSNKKREKYIWVK